MKDESVESQERGIMHIYTAIADNIWGAGNINNF